MAVGFLFAFIWSVKSGQFQDTVTPSIRILLDEPNETNNQESNNKSKTNKEK